MEYQKEDETSEGTQIIEKANNDKVENEKAENENRDQTGLESYSTKNPSHAALENVSENVSENVASSTLSNAASNDFLSSAPEDIINNVAADYTENVSVNVSGENSAYDQRDESYGRIASDQSGATDLSRSEAKAIIAQAAAEISQHKKGSKSKLIIAAITATALIALAFSTVFSLVNIGNDKILYNIKINNIDVQGLTKNEASQVLTDQYTLLESKSITLKTGEYSESISPQDIEFTYEMESAVEEAYRLGRAGNFFENNFSILQLLLKGKNIESAFDYNEENLNQFMKNIANTIPRKFIDNSHYIEGSNLFIVRGESGDSVNEEELKDSVILAIRSNISELEVPLQHKEVPEIDIDQIYKEVYTEPQDAYYTQIEGKYTIYPHVLGVSFDIQAAKKALEQKKDEYSIPLKFTYPKITTSQIGIEAFPNKLASYSTKYDPGQASRSENLKIASEKINEKVLMPGEIFSYNEVLGKRTIENGYKEAGVYEGGKLVQGVGGGICQVSSTLYNTVLLANLEIIERTNHGLPVGYVPPSRDATVSYGTIDFKFVNNRSYPVKIIAYSRNGQCSVDIYGMKEDIEYEVIIESSVLEHTPFSTVYENVSTLSPGVEKVVQNGTDGYKSAAYKVLKQDGKIISRTLLSTDRYAPMNKIIQVGR